MAHLGGLIPGSIECLGRIAGRECCMGCEGIMEGPYSGRFRFFAVSVCLQQHLSQGFCV